MCEPVEPEFCEEHCCHDAALHQVLGAVPEDGELAELAELFKVFGDSTRIRILYALEMAELCVCDLAELLHLSQPAMSYQLKILRQAKLIRNRREGKTVFYSLSDDHVKAIVEAAREHLEE